MIRDNIISIISSTWPTVLICLVIFSNLRIIYLIKNKQKIIIYKELFILIFIIYILCLFYVVTYQDVNFSTSNYIPFKEILRYTFGSRLFIKNVIGNMLMFIPYGFFASYFLKIVKPNVILLISLITSITIEITQLIIGRVFDIDDIILNVIGGILGSYIYIILNSIKSNLPHSLKKNLFYNIIMLLGVMLIALYLSDFIKLGV